MFWRGACRTPWTFSSASMRWMKHWTDMADRKSSTPIRQSVHVVGVDPAAEGGRATHLGGWTRPVPRQHLHRTAVALAEVRMHLPACLLGRAGGPSGDRRLDGLLQSSAPPCRAWGWGDAGQRI